MIGELNSFLRGWSAYFRLTAWKTNFADLDGWIRRKLRCVRLKQCKRYGTIVKFLHRQGVSLRKAWDAVLSGRRWWWLSRTPVASQAMPYHWFERLGLLNLSSRYEELQTV